MKVLIIQGYNDRVLGRTVHKGEELPVSEQRAAQLVKSGVGEIVKEDNGGRIAELETENADLKAALTEKDKYIEELKTILTDRDARIAELEAAAKKKG